MQQNRVVGLVNRSGSEGQRPCKDNSEDCKWATLSAKWVVVCTLMGCLHSREAQGSGRIRQGKVVAGTRISDLTYCTAAGIGSLMAWEPWSLAANGPDRVRAKQRHWKLSGIFTMNVLQQDLASLSFESCRFLL